jgi:hypothetical protein
MIPVLAPLCLALAQHLGGSIPIAVIAVIVYNRVGVASCARMDQSRSRLGRGAPAVRQRAAGHPRYSLPPDQHELGRQTAAQFSFRF